MKASLYPFEKLLCATSQVEVLGFLDHQCAQLGYSCYFYSPLLREQGSERFFKDDSHIVTGEDLIRQNTFTTYPSDWVYRYQDAGHVDIDPVVKHISTSNLPVFWDDLNQGAEKHLVFDEARQHGLANGITVPVSGLNGDRALFSIATDIPPEKSREQRTATAGSVLMTALYLHEAVQRISRIASNANPVRLTLREKECLQWAADGKTSWEIARILSVSERTVIFHMANATRKLNATNRRHAVVRALSLGIIAP